jgi:hypothetical protein
MLNQHITAIFFKEVQRFRKFALHSRPCGQTERS